MNNSKIYRNIEIVRNRREFLTYLCERTEVRDVSALMAEISYARLPSHRVKILSQYLKNMIRREYESLGVEVHLNDDDYTRIFPYNEIRVFDLTLVFENRRHYNLSKLKYPDLMETVV